MAPKDEIIGAAFPLFVRDPEMREVLEERFSDLLQTWRKAKVHHYHEIQESPDCRKGLDVLTFRMEHRGAFQRAWQNLKRAHDSLLRRN